VAWPFSSARQGAVSDRRASPASRAHHGERRATLCWPWAGSPLVEFEADQTRSRVMPATPEFLERASFPRARVSGTTRQLQHLFETRRVDGAGPLQGCRGCTPSRVIPLTARSTAPTITACLRPGDPERPGLRLAREGALRPDRGLRFDAQKCCSIPMPARSWSRKHTRAPRHACRETRPPRAMRSVVADLRLYDWRATRPRGGPSPAP